VTCTFVGVIILSNALSHAVIYFPCSVVSFFKRKKCYPDLQHQVYYQVKLSCFFVPVMYVTGVNLQVNGCHKVWMFFVAYFV
jgi:hypothetical protein